MTNYIILLPPSEGKAKEGNENKPFRLTENLKKYNSFISLNPDREFLIVSLKESISELDEKGLQKLFELKDGKLQEAIENCLDILNLPTLPAIERYVGTMFKAISYTTLKDSQKEKFNESTIIIDGLFGLLRPQDFIPEYKLKITSKVLETSVSNHWKERLQVDLDVLARRKIVIDLLPQTHQKILPKTIENKISIQFAKKENGKLKQEGHFSKESKGEFIRYIVEKENIDEDYIKSFKHPLGHSFDKEHSTKELYVFSK